jgi:uncharacterized membrane protein
MLQVEHVNRLFAEITALRAADWVEVNSNFGYFLLCVVGIFKYLLLLSMLKIRCNYVLLE